MHWWPCQVRAWCFVGLLLAQSGYGVSADKQANVIKIVSSLPRTGSAKAQTDTIVNGIKLALEEANYRVGDFDIVYADWDDATASAGQWTAEQEAANAKRAVRDKDVMAYIGPYNSGAAKISMPILNYGKVLTISPATTWPGLTKPGKGDPDEPDIYRPTGEVTFFRVVPPDDLQGPVGALWAKEMGVRKVYVLDDSEVYGKGIATLFAAKCRQLGIEVLGHETIDFKAQEFKSLMTKIRALGPDLVYFGGTTQSKGGQIAKDMVSAGLRCKLMVPDACYEDAFIDSAGPENVNGRCYVTFGGLPPEELTGAGKEFVKRYQARYDSLPEAYAVYGYEAAKAVLESIRQAGKKDREAILNACRGLTDFDQGALGTWSFDKNGDSSLATISGNLIDNGKFNFVKQLEMDFNDAPVTLPASTMPDAYIVEPIDFGATMLQYLIDGLAVGALFALIALGYTMVYGIVELINFAHGDVFMLGSLLALTLAQAMQLDQASGLMVAAMIPVLLVCCATFCAGLNYSIDKVVYRPLRNAPKLAPLVSAIGMSFILMNVGLFWVGAADQSFPQLVSTNNLLGEDKMPTISKVDLLVMGVAFSTMVALTLFVQKSKLGKAMRATAQDPVAARLMGINVDAVIGATFLIGGALAGIASVIYGMYIQTVGFQVGFQNGLYAFTAAVLGGIGSIPGAMFGGIIIGLVRSYGNWLVGANWTSALVFVILIVILVFRPAGLMGKHVREKV